MISTPTIVSTAVMSWVRLCWSVVGDVVDVVRDPAQRVAPGMTVEVGRGSRPSFRSTSLPKPVHRPLGDAGHDVGRGPAEQRAHEIERGEDQEDLGERGEVDARRRGHGHPREHVGELALAARPEGRLDLGLGHPGRRAACRRRPRTGCSWRSRAARGPRMLNVTPMTAKTRTTTIRRRSGRSSPRSRRRCPGSHAACHPSPAASCRSRGPRRQVGRARPIGGARRARPDRRHGPSGRSRDLLRGQLRVDDLAVGVAALQELGVGPDPDDSIRPSMTTIRSACMIVPDALGDDDDGRLDGSRRGARPGGASRS